MRRAAQWTDKHDRYFVVVVLFKAEKPAATNILNILLCLMPLMMSNNRHLYSGYFWCETTKVGQKCVYNNY